MKIDSRLPDADYPLQAPVAQFGAQVRSVHNKVISGFQALRQAKAPVAGFEPATEGLLQISGQIRYPLCHQHPSSTSTPCTNVPGESFQAKRAYLHFETSPV
ncbi:hypothetical protein PoB_001015100 [Plakobranchus ocellatus]|uniref:Uncharacterized protein n=1 Tax=Plakobranchus ocellatus TaxID=259542 RepID=A0AAV3Y8R3_9GAST|nr:hypothetical protein PoB_001015100 [Plakobranchus ocellatus]